MASFATRRTSLALLAGAALAPLTLVPRAAQAQQGGARALLDRILRMRAEELAGQISGFIHGIESQMGWTVQLPWSAGTLDQRRFDGLRLLRQTPAVTTLTQLDGNGIEQLKVSRLSMDVVASKADFSQDPKFADALAKKVYYGPVFFRETGPADHRIFEPYMTLSVAGARRDAGVSVAEVNLKMLWDLVAHPRIAEHDIAYVIGAQGELIAHANMALVLGKTDMTRLPHVQTARAAGAAPATVGSAKDFDGHEVLSTYARIDPPGWLVFVELPLDEATALMK